MSWREKLRRSVAGAAIVEFALLAPVFLALLFGVVEFCRIMWVRQVVAEAAFKSARCASMGLADCQGASNIQAYAVARAAKSGVRITTSEVTPTLSTDCNGYTANRVAIAHRVSSPVARFIPSVPTTLSSQACFPVTA